jgi:sec-independent protein translocase protein TatB
MIFDIGPLELATLAVLGFIIFGPDKLPKVIAEAARLVRKIREFSDQAKREISNELGPEFADLDLQDLNPKTFLRKQITIHGDDYGPRETQGLGDCISQDARAAAASVQAARTQGLGQVNDRHVVAAPSPQPRTGGSLPRSPDRP